MNATIRKFGYPETLVREYARWVVLLRPKQVTLGSLVVASLEPARALSEVSPAAFTELATVTRHIERALRRCFAHDRINYLLLMMVDPDVHFHVIPRYASERSFADLTLVDSAWPKPPDLSVELDIPPPSFERLRQHLVAAWGLE